MKITYLQERVIMYNNPIMNPREKKRKTGIKIQKE